MKNFHYSFIILSIFFSPIYISVNAVTFLQEKITDSGLISRIARRFDLRHELIVSFGVCSIIVPFRNMIRAITISVISGYYRWKNLFVYP